MGLQRIIASSPTYVLVCCVTYIKRCDCILTSSVTANKFLLLTVATQRIIKFLLLAVACLQLLFCVYGVRVLGDYVACLKHDFRIPSNVHPETAAASLVCGNFKFQLLIQRWPNL